MNWNHQICDDCWVEWWQGDEPREPVRIVEEFRETTKCCYCGNVTTSGIYIRRHPSEVIWPTPE